MEQRWTYCGVICCFENMEGLYRRSSRRRNCYLEMASYILMGKTRMDWIWYMQIQVGIVIFQTLNFCVENLFGFTSLDTFAQSLALSMINPRSFMLLKQATVQAAEDLAGGGLGYCLPSQKWTDLSDIRNCGHEWSVAFDAGGAKMLIAAAIRQGLPGRSFLFSWALTVYPVPNLTKALDWNFALDVECACGSRWLGPDNALIYAKYVIPKS